MTQIKTYFLFIASLVLLQSCNAKVHKEQTSEKNSDHKITFEKYFESIPSLEVPFSMDTRSSFDHAALESDFIPDGAALLGKLKSIQNHYFIIYTYPADIRLPVLEVYNSEGEKLHQENLFHYGNCPLKSSGNSRFTIESDDKIYIETVCDLYDSRIDLLDTIDLKDLVSTLK